MSTAPTPKPRPRPRCDRADALAVLQRLRNAGHTAYFAGGCVRDLLLHLDPKDYDIATDAPPDRVRSLFSNTQAVGAAFGVVLVRHHRSIIEVATFRTEGPYLDGRRPSQVHFATPQQDAQRRDFTINGLFLDPLTNEVIDYVGGQSDLATRTLRAIGQPAHRFEEDHLRLLRAVRFASRFDLTIEPQTAEALRTHAPMLKRISPERIAEELRLMLTPLTRRTAWTMLWQFDLIDVIFRFLPLPTPRPALDTTYSIFLSLSPNAPIPFGLCLAAATLCYLYQPAPTADIRTHLTRAQVHKIVRAMRQALKISNEESDELQGTLEGLEPLLADTPPTLAMTRRFLARPTSSLSRSLLAAIATATNQHTARIDSLLPELTRLSQTDYAPLPLITGDDLTSAGLTPGPLFKRILDTVYDAQLENQISTRDQALSLALGLAHEKHQL